MEKTQKVQSVEGPTQNPQQESIQIDFQTKMQLDFSIINVKLQLINLAKELVKEGQRNESVTDVYLDLREEVLGIPNPNNPVKNPE